MLIILVPSLSAVIRASSLSHVISGGGSPVALHDIEISSPADTVTEETGERRIVGGTIQKDKYNINKFLYPMGKIVNE